MSYTDATATHASILSWPPSTRLVNTLGFVACFGMIGFGLFLQHVLKLEPCPMCILQRIAIIGTGCVFAIAALHAPQGWGRKVYGGLLLLTTGIGAALSARHVWLQNFIPEDKELACGMDMSYMMDVFPIFEVLGMILKGTGDCTEVVWTFLGLSIPAWTLVSFIGLAAIAVYGNWIRTR